MVQRETLEFFAAYRYHKRKNENKTRTEDPVLFLELTKLDDIGLTRPGMAELMVHSMLCTYRNARTGTCWVSQATIARKCRLSESSVSTAFKWLLKAKLLRKMDNVRVCRKIVQGGRALPVTLITVFDLPFYRWVDDPAYGSVETDAQESWERSKTKAKIDAQAHLEARIQEVEEEPDYPLKEEHVGLVSEEMLAEAEKEEAEQEAARELRAWQEEQGQLQLLLGIDTEDIIDPAQTDMWPKAKRS